MDKIDESDTDESCMVATAKDKAIHKEYKDEIQEISDEIKENSSEIKDLVCGKKGGSKRSRGKKGGSVGESRFSSTTENILVRVIVFVITALATGASAAFFMRMLPTSWQVIIVSTLTIGSGRSGVYLPVCQTTLDYALGSGLAAATGWTTMSCSQRAELLEMAINRLSLLFGAVSSVTLTERVRAWIQGRDHTGGRKTKTKTKTKTYRYKKSRKSRISRKSRKNRK